MDARFEKEAIRRIRELKLSWEKVPDKKICRAETQYFSIYVDASTDQSINLYIKRKATSETCKIYRSIYSDKEDWSSLTEIVETSEKSARDAEAYLLREFVKDESKKQPEAPAVYVEDDLMDNTRTE